MTVATQVKQTLATLKGVCSTLEAFMSFEQDEKTKALLQKNTRRLGAVIDDLEERVKTLEYEEPQYKGF
ncbi:DUF1657 domain-containing protein [Desulfofalx alkaliphila]|uniref:DUF1657 domain-containing protein n=1 Tax=Desulfofalx alkaliphila TaxID=105483 RepID=UPI0004E23B6F|nr:DUF1657 domain-containing protein [Desulfofalx alkaliphila]